MLRGTARASDLAGNVAAASHFNWTVDTNVPDTVREQLSCECCVSAVSKAPEACASMNIARFLVVRFLIDGTPPFFN